MSATPAPVLPDLSLISPGVHLALGDAAAGLGRARNANAQFKPAFALADEQADAPDVMEKLREVSQ